MRILEAELRGFFEVLEFSLDFEIGFLAVDVGFAGGALEQIGSLEIDFGRSALQAIVHGFGGAGNRGGLSIRRNRRLCERERGGGEDENG